MTRGINHLGVTRFTDWLWYWNIDSGATEAGYKQLNVYHHQCYIKR